MHAGTAGLGSWLVKVLEGKASEGLASADELRVLYASLGLSAASLSTACDEIRLCWDPAGSRLYVLDSFLASEDHSDVVCVVVVDVEDPGLYPFPMAIVGTSCRQLALAAATGFLDFNDIEHLKDKGHVSQYESAGTSHMNDAVLRVAILLDYVAYVPECLIGIVLGDCRLLHVLPEVQEGILQEIEFLEQIPFSVWSFLAAHDQSIVLRHTVIQGATASLGHMELNIFSVLVSMPWALANGPTEEAISWLKSLESPPSSPLARKAWLLLKAGYGEDRITEAISVMKECSFSAYFSEKMHGSTATVSKFHPEYGSEQLCNRAFVHTFMPKTP